MYILRSTDLTVKAKAMADIDDAETLVEKDLTSCP